MSWQSSLYVRAGLKGTQRIVLDLCSRSLNRLIAGASESPSSTASPSESSSCRCCTGDPTPTNATT